MDKLLNMGTPFEETEFSASDNVLLRFKEKPGKKTSNDNSLNRPKISPERKKSIEKVNKAKTNITTPILHTKA